MNYIIVSTSESKYQEWQIRLLDWSRRKVKQDGKLLILLSEDFAHPNDKTSFEYSSDVEIIPLPDWAKQWEKLNDDWWGGIPNKYESFYWLSQFYPFKVDDILLFLDPDMIFTEKISIVPTENEIVGQKWVGYGPIDGWPSIDDPFMYPFVLRYGALKKISQDFKNNCEKIRRQVGKWESDMWGLIYAAKSNSINVRIVERLGVCTAWHSMNDNKAVSPIIHFPNVVESKSAERLFFKQDYTFKPLQDIIISKTRNATDQSLLINVSQERTDFLYHLKYEFDILSKRYTGSDGHIVLKPWPGGFNNIRMSLEISVCLAFLLNRTLVLPPSYEMYLLDGSSQIEDFFNLGHLQINIVKFYDFCQKLKIKPDEEVLKERSKLIDFDFVGSVLNFEKVPVPDWFAKARPELRQYEVFDESPILYFNGKLLGNFYQSLYTSYNTELKMLIAQQVVYRNDIFDFAWQLINHIGDQTYYAIHIRRNDFQYKDLFISCEEILQGLIGIVPKYSTLYVSTDHKDYEFFKPLRECYNLIFFDEVISSLDIDITNSNWIPILEQLICTRAIKFIGMKLSTFSSYIYRLRGYMSDISDKYYYLNGQEFRSDDQRDFRKDNRFIANWAREYKCSWNFEKPLIFLSIAAYCDTQLIPTIDDALREASNPERIILGVHLQDTDIARKELLDQNYLNLKLIYTPKEQAEGAVWARNRIKRELYCGEDYFMQIDSHSRFKNNWDNLLINQFESIQEDRVVLTTYPNHFEISDEDRSYLQLTNHSPLRIRKFLTDYWEENRLTAGNSHKMEDYEIKESKWCAAGFLFTTKDWVESIKVPDDILFNGEEDLMTHLSFLKGYNLRVTSEACVWHNYNYKNEKTGERYKEFNPNMKRDDAMSIVNRKLFGSIYERSINQLQDFIQWKFKPVSGYEKIYVAIASFMDEDIISTIQNCYENAMYPNNLSFGVCWQYNSSKDRDESFLDNLTEVYSIKINSYPFQESKGVGWARSKALEHYSNERYFVIADSHTRFINHWDSILIRNYTLLSVSYRKPLISYLPPLFFSNAISSSEYADQLDLIEIPQIESINFDYTFNYQNRGVTKTYHNNVVSPTIEPSFLFGYGAWIKEVGSSDKIYYEGEDVDLSIRSYLAGYDFFTPNQIVSWRSESLYRKKHYESVDIDKVKESHQNSLLYLRGLVKAHQKEENSILSPRTINDYEFFIGRSFSNHQIPLDSSMASVRIKIYIPILSEAQMKTYEMRMVIEGTMMHSEIDLVDHSFQADYILITQQHLFGSGRYNLTVDELISSNKGKVVYLDYGDLQQPISRGNTKFLKLYFKMSMTVKGQKNSKFDYGDRDIKFLGYSALFSYLKPYNPCRERTIDISCLFSEEETNHVRTIKGRHRVVSFLKSQNFKDFNTVFDKVSEGGEVGRSSDNPDYFNVLRNSKILVTCNPDRWEGDSRLWEALSSGCLVFVDRMINELYANPLVDKEHLIYYDLSKAGLEKLYNDILYYLKNDSERIEISEQGYEYVRKNHMSINRVDKVVRLLKSTYSKN